MFGLNHFDLVVDLHGGAKAQTVWAVVGPQNLGKLLYGPLVVILSFNVCSYLFILYFRSFRKAFLLFLSLSVPVFSSGYSSFLNELEYYSFLFWVISEHKKSLKSCDFVGLWSSL